MRLSLTEMHTSLSTSNNVMALQNRRETVRLDRSGNSVACKFDIIKHYWMKASIGERTDWLDLSCTLLNDVDLLDSSLRQ